MSPDELPAVWLGLLERPPPCPELVRRTLDGARGADRAPQVRYAVGNRLREAARTAHAEMRAPTAADFPDPTDLEPEQRLVHRAGALGYLTLFPEPAVACDVPTDPLVFDDLGVRMFAPRDLVVRTAGGTVEVRRLQVSGRGPQLGTGALHVLALVAARWSPPLPSLRVVVADLLALEITEALVEAESAVLAATEWVSDRHRALVDASLGAPKSGEQCLRCDYVWDCTLHARSRRSAR